jgi:hypothetical protein
MMPISEPSHRKAVPRFRRSSAGHGSARSDPAFTMQQPHRSSPTHRPRDRNKRIAPQRHRHPHRSTTPRCRLPLWRAHGQIPIAEREAPPNTCPFSRFRPSEVSRRWRHVRCTPIADGLSHRSTRQPSAKTRTSGRLKPGATPYRAMAGDGGASCSTNT